MREPSGGKPLGEVKAKVRLTHRGESRRTLVCASSTDPHHLWWDLSESVPVATRKMVNYARTG